MVASDDDEGGDDAADEAAVPGESHPAEMVQAEGVDVLEEVVDLRTDKTPHGGPQHESVGRVAAQPNSLESAAEQVRCDKCSNGLAGAVGREVKAKDREQHGSHKISDHRYT